MDDLIEERRDHVYRSGLPWRTERMTECGKAESDVAACITADELATRISRFGKQRTAFTICMTCWTTTEHAPRWETHPVGVIFREAKRAGAGYITPSDKPAAHHLADELRAIEALIAAHRDEFDEYITGLADTADLASRRKQRGSRR